jgi:hypothetical protein
MKKLVKENLNEGIPNVGKPDKLDQIKKYCNQVIEDIQETFEHYYEGEDLDELLEDDSLIDEAYVELAKFRAKRDMAQTILSIIK